MIPGFLTVLIMAIAAYVMWREGPLTAFAMFCNVLIAGVIAFCVWEPLADLLDPVFSGGPVEGFEDVIALMVPFLIVLALLRWVTNSLARSHMEYPPLLYRGGAVFFGLLTGYFLSGFLLCVVQTLPWHQNFMGFEPYNPGESSGARKVMPPDVVWLAAMQRLSAKGLSWEDGLVFDKGGSFELRYHRYRRWDDAGNTLTPRGEIDPKQ